MKAYKKSNRKYVEEFGSSPQVVFIVDVQRERLKLFIRRYTAEITENMSFTDYRTFLKAESVIDDAIWIVNSGEEKSLND